MNTEAIDPATLEARILACYQAAAERMTDLPLYNPALSTELVGWQKIPSADSEHSGHWLGVVITPWSMMLWVKPDDSVRGIKGSEWSLPLPVGECTLIHARTDATGPFASASLMSVMTDLNNQEEARAIAQEILKQLLTPATAATMPTATDQQSAAQHQATPTEAFTATRREFLTAFRHRATGAAE